jgi:hypothetical protein
MPQRQAKGKGRFVSSKKRARREVPIALSTGEEEVRGKKIKSKPWQDKPILVHVTTSQDKARQVKTSQE